MNELLAQFYGTNEKIAAASQPAPATENEQFDAAVVDEIVKVAEANGIDLNQISDEEMLEVINAFKQEMLAGEGSEKTASAQDEMDQFQEADLLGRTMAHAYFSELSAIQEQLEGHQKLAGFSDEEIFEALATQRAENILAALQGDGEGFMKEASMTIEDEELDDLVTERCAEILDANGYDVEMIAAALEG